MNQKRTRQPGSIHIYITDPRDYDIGSTVVIINDYFLIYIYKFIFRSWRWKEKRNKKERGTEDGCRFPIGYIEGTKRDREK